MWLLILCLFLLSAPQQMFAQQTPSGSSEWIQTADVPPANMLSRTVPVKVGDTFGTAFITDYKGKQYLVTAKHVVKDLSAHHNIVQLWEDVQWRNLVVHPIYCKSADVDAVALSFDVPEKLSNVEGVEIRRTPAAIGNPVFFFGFPVFGDHFLHTTVKSTGQYMPLVKRGIFSASDWIDPDARVFYFDGFNNKGFSGGPIVTFDDEKKRWEIIAVIQGYQQDVVKVSGGRFVDSQALVNSGIMLGYDARHVLDAIDTSLVPGK